MLRKIYVAIGSFIIVLYGYLGFTGWEPGTSSREKIPPGARRGTGSYHIWYSGYRGGK